jgi:hypothetical protein
VFSTTCFGVGEGIVCVPCGSGSNFYFGICSAVDYSRSNHLISFFINIARFKVIVKGSRIKYSFYDQLKCFYALARINTLPRRHHSCISLRVCVFLSLLNHPYRSSTVMSPTQCQRKKELSPSSQKKRSWDTKIFLLASNIFCGRLRAWVSDRHGYELNIRSISIILPIFAQFLNNHRPVNDWLQKSQIAPFFDLLSWKNLFLFPFICYVSCIVLFPFYSSSDWCNLSS